MLNIVTKEVKNNKQFQDCVNNLNIFYKANKTKYFNDIAIDQRFYDRI